MTALCVIPGCRIRGRHAPGCDDEQCAGCLPRTADDGNVCEPCRDRIADRLDAIAQLAPDARLTARGLVKRGGGSGSNKPGSRPPLNDHATDVLDQVTNSMTTWARHVIETRGITGPTGSGDALAVVARFLGANLGWMTHRAEVDEFAGDVGDCAGRLRSLVNGPAEQKYLGPCGAPLDAEPGDMPSTAVVVVCEGDVYGPRGGRAGRCRACGAEVATRDREAWLDGQVRNEAFSAKWIGEAHGIPVKTIRSWATERPEVRDGSGRILRSATAAKLRSYWRTETGIVAEWPPLNGEEHDRLHYVGDVLDLAAADAARRETNRAKRERRLTLANTEEDAA